MRQEEPIFTNDEEQGSLDRLSRLVDYGRDLVLRLLNWLLGSLGLGLNLG